MIETRENRSVVAVLIAAATLAVTATACASRLPAASAAGDGGRPSGWASAASPTASPSSLPSSSASPASPSPSRVSRTSTPAAPATSGPSDPGNTWPSAAPPGEPALDEAAGKIEPMLKKDFAASYASLYIQQPLGPKDKTAYAIIVYRIPDAALDAAVRAAIPGTTVIFSDTRMTLEDAQHTMSLVDQDVKSYWPSKGVRINMWGPGRDGRCQIGVDDPDKVRALFEARYGADHVVVIQMGQAIAD